MPNETNHIDVAAENGGKQTNTRVVVKRIFTDAEKAAQAQEAQKKANLLAREKAASAQAQVAAADPAHQLEQCVRDLVAAAHGFTDFSYHGIENEAADRDRPKGTRMITVSVDIKSFLDKSTLIGTSGRISSKPCTIIQPSMLYDVFVWYYGETTDRYGNKKNDVVLTYHIDKSTYQKINWSNFNKGNLCNFLEQEASGSTVDNTACKVLANLQ